MCAATDLAVQEMLAARDVHDHEHPTKSCRCKDCRLARIGIPPPRLRFDWEIQVVPWDEV